MLLSRFSPSVETLVSGNEPVEHVKLVKLDKQDIPRSLVDIPRSLVDPFIDFGDSGASYVMLYAHSLRRSNY